MTNPAFGTKHVCQSCSARYYDLHRDPIICPKCGTTFEPAAVLKRQPVRYRPEKARVAEPVPLEASEEAAEEDEAEVVTEEDEEAAEVEPELDEPGEVELIDEHAEE